MVDHTRTYVRLRAQWVPTDGTGRSSFEFENTAISVTASGEEVLYLYVHIIYLYASVYIYIFMFRAKYNLTARQLFSLVSDGSKHSYI